MFKKVKENKKGFTLAELLIVVAIIAVLVAISIPIFTTQLEKSREAVDLANIRSAYAEVAAEVLSDETTAHNAKVTLTQNDTNSWVIGDDNKVAGVSVGDIEISNDKQVSIAYDPNSTDKAITIGGAAATSTSITDEKE